ncbi:hypothetical protein HNQ02_003243 [Flavobacterium sp. 7E]|uniref:DUF2971 domain-containing protein n=1 Tax=Flavobacterium sp. 7E TaxID=2735898 RepID=UPI0015706367|nr:DUF2971 domain-containing protein [Flavobacterium sp. 7E]NRS90305.1 hypothetical protein [Flavobacterium sp. 7E]
MTERIDDFLKTVINPIWPNAKFSECFMSGFNIEQNLNYFNAKLWSGDLLKGSDYEYNGDGKFIHYSSLQGLKAILDSGFLRMSEFSSLIDKNEMNYGADVFKSNSSFQYYRENTDNLKSNIFCLSVCESSENTKRDNLMWETYGDKGKGIIIEFSLTKKDPKFFVLGKIQYGKDARQPLYDLKEKCENYLKGNNLAFPNNFPELMTEIQSFHKSMIYEGEREVRLLFKNNVNYPSETVYRDFNSNQEVKSFNKLFLKGRHLFSREIDEDVNYLDEYPQIEIKNIILGFNISGENKVAITDLLQEIKKQHSYDYDVFQINSEKEIY